MMTAMRTVHARWKNMGENEADVAI
jgi:hypothetical protein